MYQMNLQLSTLSKANLKKLLKMLDCEMSTLNHPCGHCGNCESECETCPHDEYCSYLCTMHFKIETELNSRPG